MPRRQGHGVPDIYGVLRHAILNRLHVSLVHAGRRREVCPHVLGTWRGETRVLVFQFAGESSSGLPPGGDWRCLKLAQITEAAPHAGTWRSRPHGRPQRCVDTIDVEVND